MIVFLTIDVEIWCGGWDRLDDKFPDAFRRYVYGRSPRGDYALPYIVRVLQDHGLRAVFFVEALFAARFGLHYLAEIVDLLRRAGQEVQLHLHPEWTDEILPALLPGPRTKRQHLCYYSYAEQEHLIRVGKELLAAAGASEVNAFRAGSFACDRATLRALRANGFSFDSSVNPCLPISGADLRSDERGQSPRVLEGTVEYPMTVFRQPGGALRHAQIGSCSAAELEHLLWRAREQDREAFVLLSHNFETLRPNGSFPDRIVTARFRRLCAFLDRHRDLFPVSGFGTLAPCAGDRSSTMLTSPLHLTARRVLEQAASRFLG